MAKFVTYLHRYRWWILAGFTLIVFSLIFLLALDVLSMEDYSSQIEAPEQLLPTFSYTQVAITDTPTPISQAVLTPMPTMETKISEAPIRQLAFVQRVIDGDSIEVILDGEIYQLRYIGIDAPEIGMPFFKEASEANDVFVGNQIVELERDISDTDKYGRLLRYVYLPDGRMVNVELVGSGWASAIAYPPDIKHQDLIISSEQEAKNAGIGLWAPLETPAQDLALSTEFDIHVDPACSQFNAPGNDNDNKNEEYVCIVNKGPGTVELNGWSIRDEYGWSYQFPLINLEGNSKLRLFTGCGNDSSEELYWCKDETAVWNNDGDCVYLQDPEGIEVEKYCY